MGYKKKTITKPSEYTPEGELKPKAPKPPKKRTNKGGKPMSEAERQLILAGLGRNVGTIIQGVKVSIKDPAVAKVCMCMCVWDRLIVCRVVWVVS